MMMTRMMMMKRACTRDDDDAAGGDDDGDEYAIIFYAGNPMYQISKTNYPSDALTRSTIFSVRAID